MKIDQDTIVMGAAGAAILFFLLKAKPAAAATASGASSGSIYAQQTSTMNPLAWGNTGAGLRKAFGIFTLRD